MYTNINMATLVYNASYAKCFQLVALVDNEDRFSSSVGPIMRFGVGSGVGYPGSHVPPLGLVQALASSRNHSSPIGY